MRGRLTPGGFGGDGEGVRAPVRESRPQGHCTQHPMLGKPQLRARGGDKAVCSGAAGPQAGPPGVHLASPGPREDLLGSRGLFPRTRRPLPCLGSENVLLMSATRETRVWRCVYGGSPPGGVGGPSPNTDLVAGAACFLRWFGSGSAGQG